MHHRRCLPVVLTRIFIYAIVHDSHFQDRLVCPHRTEIGGTRLLVHAHIEKRSSPSLTRPTHAFSDIIDSGPNKRSTKVIIFHHIIPRILGRVIPCLIRSQSAIIGITFTYQADSFRMLFLVLYIR